MRKNSAVPPSHGGWPAWYDGKNINEVLFCEEFLAAHPMKCIRGRLFTVDGAVEDEAVVSQQILETVSGCVTSGLSKLVSNLLASIKLQAYSPPLPIETDRIHVANGTYFMDGRFSPEKTYCNNRLAVGYLPDAPRPERWLRFLSELLEPEDIPTLQEYLGYCLLPTTRAQKMLLIIGRGGEGKSRIGLVMRAILGDSMNTTSIQKVENNRFSRADLEHKLLMVDDDMDLSALPKTNYIKSIITSECKMDLERKGVQSYQRGVDGASRPVRRLLPAADRPDHQGPSSRPSRRSLPGREAGSGAGGHFPVVPGGAAPPHRPELPLYDQPQGPGERGNGAARQQQCGGVFAVGGVHPLSCGL